MPEGRLNGRLMTPCEPSLTRRELLAAGTLGGLSTLLSGCGSSSALAAPAPSPATVPGPVPAAPPGRLGAPVQANLLLLRDAVGALTDPVTGVAATVPHFDELLAAAGRLDSVPQPVVNASMIVGLLGRAQDFDCEAPTATYSLQFPRDHHIHPRMGEEWYYLALVLQVTDPAGTQGRLALLLDLNKQRVLGLTAQQRFGLSDNDTILWSSTATATLDFPQHKRLVRRSLNAQWPLAGGSASFSQPGEPFRVACGPDSLSGTADVLPLDVAIQDGSNLTVSLRLLPAAGFSVPNSFFLQGLPDAQGAGTGVTSVPTPGLYYSWPQLRVDLSAPPRLVVDGVTYTVRGGVGWLDHQVLMQSLQNPFGAVSPVPFLADPTPFSGWCWQDFNLTNGHAVTGSAFQNWYLSANPTFSYGYYVMPVQGRWQATFLTGVLGLGQFRTFPVRAGAAQSTLTVQLPNQWSYLDLTGPPGVKVQGAATPWFTDGSFNFPDLSIEAENPVDFVSSGGTTPDGSGFCESVGFEPHPQYVQRTLAFLAG